MDKQYVLSSYFNVLNNMFSSYEPKRKKRYTDHNDHTPKKLLHEKKKKRKTVSKARKRNRK